MWIELMRELGREAGGTLVFFSEASDASEEAHDLFRQLATSKWTKHCGLLLALTRLDELIEQVRAMVWRGGLKSASAMSAVSA